MLRAMQSDCYMSLSVCLSVTLVHCGEMAELIIICNNKTILVF